MFITVPATTEFSSPNRHRNRLAKPPNQIPIDSGPKPDIEMCSTTHFTIELQSRNSIVGRGLIAIFGAHQREHHDAPLGPGIASHRVRRELRPGLLSPRDFVDGGEQITARRHPCVRQSANFRNIEPTDSPSDRTVPKIRLGGGGGIRTHDRL